MSRRAIRINLLQLRLFHLQYSVIFFIIPISFVAISPGIFYDSATVLRAILLFFIPLFLFIRRPVNLKQYKFLLVMFSFLILVYIISALSNEQRIIDFAFGSYGRGFGTMSLIGFCMIFILSASNIANHSQQLMKSMNIVLIISLLYGAMQVLKIDPFNWEQNVGVSLTLGNSNFASAFLGIIAILPAGNLIHNRSRALSYSVATLCLCLFLLYKTNSVQGIFLFLIGVFLLVYYKIRISKKLKNGEFKFLAIIVVCILSGIIYLQSQNKFTDLVNSTNYIDRLRHFRLALKIFKDNYVFGVGIDAMGTKSGGYLTLEDARAWGNYGQPDKSHNFILDTLVGGGIVAGLLLFIMYVTMLTIQVKIFYRQAGSISKGNHIIIVVMSMCYLLQTLISPDSIFLFTFGAVLCGSVYGLYLEKSKEIQKK